MICTKHNREYNLFFSTCPYCYAQRLEVVEKHKMRKSINTKIRILVDGD